MNRITFSYMLAGVIALSLLGAMVYAQATPNSSTANTLHAVNLTTTSITTTTTIAANTTTTNTTTVKPSRFPVSNSPLTSFPINNFPPTARINAKYNIVSNQSILGWGYDTIYCRTLLVDTLVNQTVAESPNLSYLKNDTDSLIGYNLQLKSYAQNDMVVGFATYLHTTYDPQLALIYAQARSAISTDNRLNASQKLALQGAYFSSLTNYQNCVAPSLENLSIEKLAFYNNSTVKFNSQIADLAAKGVNTSNMTAVVRGGQTTIIAPFQTAIQNNTNATQIWAALNKYCLFNGCPTGLNYHLDARFSIAKLYAIEARLRNATNDTSALNSANLSLNSASAELSKVGLAQYPPGASQQVWQNIDRAEISLRLALSKVG